MNERASDSASFLALDWIRADRPGAGLARTLGPLFLIGPAIGLGSVIVSNPTDAKWPPIVVIVTLAWLIGLAMVTGRMDSMSPGFFLAAAYVGNVLLTEAIYFAHNTDMGAAFLYLWQVPFAFHYFRSRQAITLIGFSALCFGVLLIAQDEAGIAPLRLGRWIAMVGTSALLGLSVHQLSHAARRSHQRFHAIFEHGSFGTALVDAEGVVLEVNPALERLAARTASQLLGQPFSQYLHPDDLPGFVKALTTFETGEAGQAQVDCRMVRPDGSSREAMVTISGIRNTAGRLAGYVGIVEDLTERRRAGRAEAENQAKSRFLALMSHELRTPLNAVLGFSQLLERRDFGPLNDRQIRYVSNIRTAGQNLLTLVNDLLDFSKLSADRMDFHVEPVNLQELVDEVVGGMRPSADDKKLLLGQSVEPGLTAYADRFRLGQVLLNLVSNAIKFTNAGTVTLNARAAGDKACITVTDTGIGIPADQVPRVFSEFAQLDRGTEGTQQGTGLGLALSRRLVFGMGGTIHVESQQGNGSTFTVLIPRVGPASGTV